MVATAYKAINLPVQSVTVTWGDALNNGPFADLDSMIAGIVTKSLTNAPVALTATEAKNAIVRLTGALSGNVAVTIPAVGLFAVQNATTGNFLVTVQGSAGSAQIVAQGVSTIVHIDGTNGAFLAGARPSTVGMIAQFIGTTVPGGWLECDGSLISRTTYANLWTYAQASGNIQTDANWTANAMFGAFSTGDGSTTFRIPDLRGTFMRSWAHGGATDAGRTAGQLQTGQVQNHTHPIAVTDNHFHYSWNTDTTTNFTTTPSASNYPMYSVLIQGYYSDYVISASNTLPTVGKTSTSQNAITAASSNNTGGGAENRPTNMAEMYCISYL
jgi:microcystin-dependent protein